MIVLGQAFNYSRYHPGQTTRELCTRGLLEFGRYWKGESRFISITDCIAKGTTCSPQYWWTAFDPCLSLWSLCCLWCSSNYWQVQIWAGKKAKPGVCSICPEYWTATWISAVGTQRLFDKAYHKIGKVRGHTFIWIYEVQHYMILDTYRFIFLIL